MRRPTRPQRGVVCCALALAALAAAVGCREATAPPPAAEPAPAASYRPAGEMFTLARGEWYDFRVIASPGSQVRVRWQRGDEPEATGERYRFFARGLGSESLVARISDDADRQWLRAWTVTVVPAGTPRVDFRPQEAEVRAYATVEAVFAATSPWPIAATSWRLDGAPAAGDTLLRLVPAAPGRREVAVTVAAADTTFTRTWSVDVRPFAEARPPAVTGLALAPGNAPGRAVLAWDRLDDSVLPLAGYEVRYRWDGPPTAESWADDPNPGDYPYSPDQARPTVLYTPENAGLEPDREVWFAVRARNDRGQLSPVAGSARLRLPGRWWVEGTVRAPGGEPLAGIRVADRDHRHATLSDDAGAYRVGPYFELAKVVIEAGTPADAPAGASWHLSRSDSLSAAGTRRQDFILIPRLGTAAQCFNFGSHFLWYLRTMTKTRVATLRRPNVNLYHWTEYPVPVHVPQYVSPGGVDYGACARRAVRIWNESLDRPILALVDDPAAARIGFRFDLVDGLDYGVVTLDQPGDGELIIGDTTPLHASVRMRPDLPAAQPCTEIALHELGHALGLHDHAYCNTVPYLMYVSALGSLDFGEENAIHPDERRAVQIIRNLPDGWNMGLYPLEGP